MVKNGWPFYSTQIAAHQQYEVLQDAHRVSYEPLGVDTDHHRVGSRLHF